MNFSKFRLVNASGHIPVHELLTYSALLEFLCRNPSNRKDFSHNLDDHVRHFCAQRDVCVHFESPKEHFYTPKYVQKGFMARTNVLRCLRTVFVRMADIKK